MNNVQKKIQLQQIQIPSDIDKQWKKTPSSIVDTNQTTSVLTDLLIDRDLYPLRIELERRRGMLKCDAKGHQYIEAFLNLKPQPSEVRSNLRSTPINVY